VEIEGRTDDILTFGGGVQVAPMSLYKVLEEVPSLRRFQLVQRAADAVELRLTAEDPGSAFGDAKAALTAFFESKGLEVTILPSDAGPQADPVSGKFKHIYRARD
jgi:phenylacetate-coenzyme A ligase PaaK-like adenylate-forming protein